MRENRESIAASVTIGALTGGIEAFIINPVVTAKTCAQTNVQVPWHWVSANKKWDFTKFLFRGATAHTVGMASIISVRMSVRDAVIQHGFKTKTPSFRQETLAAFAGGMISALLTAPMELGMTLQQTDAAKKSKNFITTYKNVISTCGLVKGLTGTTCVAARDGVVTGGFLTFTPRFREYLQRHTEMGYPMASAVAGGTVGSLCAVSTHFLDTIKSIQQKNLRDIPDPKASTISYVARDLWAKEGLKGFNRGLYWRTARVAPHIAIVSFVSDVLTNVWNEKISAPTEPTQALPLKITKVRKLSPTAGHTNPHPPIKPLAMP